MSHTLHTVIPSIQSTPTLYICHPQLTLLYTCHLINQHVLYCLTWALVVQTLVQKSWSKKQQHTFHTCILLMGARNRDVVVIQS